MQKYDKLFMELMQPILQKIDLKLLKQPCSSSYCKRNLNVYSFTYVLKRNKTARAVDLIVVHNNIRLFSRQYKKKKN